MILSPFDFAVLDAAQDLGVAEAFGIVVALHRAVYLARNYSGGTSRVEVLQ